MHVCGVQFLRIRYTEVLRSVPEDKYDKRRYTPGYVPVTHSDGTTGYKKVETYKKPVNSGSTRTSSATTSSITSRGSSFKGLGSLGG